MMIYVGADHNGFHLRGKLIKYLQKAGYDVVDEGDQRLDPNDDFPIFAHRVVTDVLTSEDKDPRGVLICGSGQGMCMAANRFKNIRAALIYDSKSAKTSRNDDNSNVACIPADLLKEEQAHKFLDIWLTTPFAGAPRFVRRLNELDALN